MLLAWYATVRHDLMASPEGRGGHGPAASGPVLDDVRSGAGMGGASFQVSVPDRPRGRGRAPALPPPPPPRRRATPHTPSPTPQHHRPPPTHPPPTTTTQPLS